MSAIFQNKFGNWVLALTSVLCAFTWMPSANAQDADSRITGSCTPRTQDQGPWDCKINKLIRNDCLGIKSNAYDEVWRLVRNSDEAAILLKSMYLNLGGPVKFSQWLGCQGFDYVQMFSPQADSSNAPTMFNRGVTVHFGISYSRENPPFPIFWLTYFLTTGGDFEIDIDKFGQIKNIQYISNSIF